MRWIAVSFAVVCLACQPAPPEGPGVVVETDSPAIGEGSLKEAVGILSGPDRFAPLLLPGCALPCERTVPFSTALDGQTEIPVSVLRGSSRVASENHPLGDFTIFGVPPRPAGQAQISLTVAAVDGDLRLSAEDSAGAPLRIEPR